MSRNPRLYLEDIQLSSAKVIRYTAGLSFEQFKTDERNLEIIGVAAKNVPDEIRQRYPLTEWRKISAFRDIAAHQYFSISDSIIWDIVQNKIPELSVQIEQVMKELPE
jgi:uncharacterized protein with HEPN domain